MPARVYTKTALPLEVPSTPGVRTSEAFLLLAAGLGLTTVNPFLTAGSFAALAVILRLCVRPGEPPLFAAVMGLLWLQCSLQVLHADVTGTPVWQTSQAHEIEMAVALSLVWVVVLSIGVRMALSGVRIVVYPRAEDTVPHAIPRLFAVYWMFYAGTVAVSLVPYSGLRQLVGTATALRSAIVFALFFLAVRGAPHARYAWGLFVFELLTGFLGFFSAFKTPLLLLLIALLGRNRKFSAAQLGSALVVAVLTVGLGIVWTAIKGDYREALNQGTGAQVVMIDEQERAQTLAELVSQLDGASLKKAADQMAVRIAYVEYFAYVLDYVPRLREHEHGRLWGGAFAHVFYPRLFFPDKPDLESDTTITERYTGLDLGNPFRQTSISIGIPGETYVDFGEFLMFVPAFLIGLMLGFTFRWLRTMSRYPELALGLATAVLLQQHNIGLTTAKLLGGHLTMLGVAVVLWKMFGPRIEAWVFEGAQPRQTQ